MPIVDPRLTLPALALALGSAALHAAWNLLLAGRKDIQAAAAATFVLSVAFASPLAVIWWNAEPSVWPYALASAVLETVYVVALAYAYRVGDLSFVYPVTRGVAPVLALLATIAVLGHAVSVSEVVGILIVAGGVVLVRGPEGSADARALLAVATISASIAAYTLVDRVGIQHAGALTYFVLVLAGPALVYPPIVGIAAVRREIGLITVVAAGANLGSFLLGLLALRRAAAAPVLAVRSTSIVIATLLAGRVLSEHVSRGRLAGSILVFAGVAVLAL
jgi:drug/metabolite transporter (DMT)-like permease